MTLQDILKAIERIKEKIQAIAKQIEEKKEAEETDDYIRFREALGQRESGGNYKIVNSLGYMGKYQFGMARLSDLGYTVRKAGTTGFANHDFKWKEGMSQQKFLNDPELQDEIFKEHVVDLLKTIRSRYSGYLGKIVNGIPITEAGLVAGAHLGGIGGIGRFLRDGFDAGDSYGTQISYYIKKFGVYDLSKVG